MKFQNVTREQALREMLKVVVRKMKGVDKNVDLHLINIGSAQGHIMSTLMQQKNSTMLIDSFQRLLSDMFMAGIIIQKKVDVKIDWTEPEFDIMPEIKEEEQNHIG